MNRWLAIVAYRCEVAGVPTDSLDIQVRYFEADSAEEVKSRLYDQPDHVYAKPYGDLVTWLLACVVAVEPFSETSDGEEVVGFIARTDELVCWTRDDDSEDDSVALLTEDDK
jgi:hypothetical protein